ncbi:MAG: glycerophosphodiester phosphodiesterase [bacterium]|nr:MAG: glycerophosphodiester phosphodiesterase [bacterium]
MKPLIIAHRGASAYAHENTLEAFRIAVEMGADMIELDVRRTGDGTLIVLHDGVINGRPVGEQEYDEIHAYGVSMGFIVPTLADTLDYTAGKIGMNIELKEEGYESDVADLALKHFGSEDLVITSSLDGAVQRIKDRFPAITTGLVLGASIYPSGLRNILPGRRIKATGADILSVDARLMRFGFMALNRRLRRPVYVWTVNDRKTIWRLLSTGGVEGIFTDRPDVALFLREVFHRAQS